MPSAGGTVSSNGLKTATVSLTTGTSDSISQVCLQIMRESADCFYEGMSMTCFLQTTVSHAEQRKPRRTRSAVDPKSEPSEADLVGETLCCTAATSCHATTSPSCSPAAAFTHSMQSFLAKQQLHQDSSPEDSLHESGSDVDIDGLKETTPKNGIHDIKALNSKLTKLALAHSVHLVDLEQLLLLLDALDSTMQQGESQLIGTNAKVGCCRAKCSHDATLMLLDTCHATSHFCHMYLA